MSHQKTPRKPLVWIMIDLVITLMIGVAGINIFIPENTFMPEILRSLPGVPLAIIGIVATVISSVLFFRSLKSKRDEQAGVVKKNR